MIKNIIWLLCIILSLWSIYPIAASTQPASLINTDIIHIDRNYQPADVRRQLSISQQAQILSDVQQHEHQFNIPVPLKDQTTPAITSFAKYNVDTTESRNAAQSPYYYQQQHHHQADYISQQKNPSYSQINRSPLLTQSLRQSEISQHPQWGIQQNSQHQTQRQGDQEGWQKDISPLSNNDQELLTLKNYFEKQQGLELLQRQAAQLLIDRQELMKQQQLLKLKELQHLSTVQPFTTLKPNIISATIPSLILTTPTVKKIAREETELFLRAIEKHKQKFSPVTTTSPFISINKLSNVTSNQKSEKQSKEALQKSNSSFITLKGDKLSSNIQESNILAVTQSKPQMGIIFSTEEAPVEHKKYAIKTNSEQAMLPITFESEREALLKQLTAPISHPSVDHTIKKLSVGDLFLSNGEKLNAPHSPFNRTTAVDRNTTSSLKVTITTIKPPNVILEELTKDVLPPGTDFEVIRHKGDGSLEDLGKLPIQNIHSRKVTFVVLEEQPNGSYKIQGIKGNSENGGEGDVQSIVDKIKSGELKLPPSALHPQKISTSIPFLTKITEIRNATKSTERLSTLQPTAKENSFSSTKNASATRFVNHEVPSRNSDKSKRKNSSPYVTEPWNFIPPTEYYVTSTATPSGQTLNASFPLLTMRIAPKTSTTQLINEDIIKHCNFTGVNCSSTMEPISKIITTTPYAPASSTFSNPSSNRLDNLKLINSPSPRSIINTLKITSTTNNIHEGNFQNSLSFPTISPTAQLEVKCRTNCQENLLKVLKRKGFFAMAKFLKQSGLDGILNETGLYTIFVPTDKAFRSLLVQLGGPEKAEQKFQDNPRLLSGLLLHHIIPGSFRVDSLLDEMTGVSLAGTQLRVNVYSMQDHEWNDVKITTVNGVKILPEKKDIEVTQGVIQSIDRVMFPLPVGDLVQTMLADREARFTTFIEMLRASGIEDSLSGSTTFTVFAPTNAAFTATGSQSGYPAWTDIAEAEFAKAIVARHIVPTTLYTAGINYYQQKSTIESRTTIHLHKSNGRIRVNDAQLITFDIPATNGVLHAIDALL